ncbi:hypothetical protein I6I87_10925 [Moraxella osloensis]|nr:hypothetical protein [Moraxella osloensis]QQU06536.1 hypothetical protein I6I87_10925 [Moraxella osloensis]
MKLHQSIKPSTYPVSHHLQPLSRVLTLSAFTVAMVSLNFLIFGCDGCDHGHQTQHYQTTRQNYNKNHNHDKNHQNSQ